MWAFVSKVMYLLFNVLSRFVKAFFSKKQASCNLMAAVICSDSGAQENSLLLFILFPHLFAMK